MEDHMDHDQIREFVEKNCQQYLNEIDDTPTQYVMWRGISKRDEYDYLVVNTRTDRRPLGTDIKVHNKFVKAFRKNDFIANRNNSVFCTGNRHEAQQYGLVYAMFPIGRFDYTWSPYVEDLIIVSRDMPEDISEFVKENYQDYDIISAIESGNEIMISCDKVLLVNPRILMDLF